MNFAFPQATAILAAATACRLFDCHHYHQTDSDFASHQCVHRCTCKEGTWK